jgi:hypothetical protein
METRTGIAMEYESGASSNQQLRPHACPAYPKPGLSQGFYLSLLVCFPATCGLWAAIIYAALRLVR